MELWGLNMPFERLDMDAGRICDGLSRIGYTPPTAIADIMDNAVTARAKQITVKIIRENEARSDSRRDNVREYLIIDDGAGMDEAGIRSALALGTTDLHYSSGSLSKFGLGLKSASFSQGEILEVLSSTGDGPFLKYRVSLKEVRAQGMYGTESLSLTGEDEALIGAYLPEGHGTIVRITDVRKSNHPSIKTTVDELQQRVGIIYYYFMHEDGLRIEIDGKQCQPLDALFTEEANQARREDGSIDGLNEFTWDGRQTRWIQTPTEIVLQADATQTVKAIVEVTQLPHPPSFQFDGEGKQNEINSKYRLQSGNYGYYVYRNKRLLSWAEGFAGTGKPIIPQAQSFFAFRGRILLEDDADDVINLDVKKSHIMLSDEAYKALSDVSANLKRKSRTAWVYAAQEAEKRKKEDSISTVNRIANEAAAPDDLPGVPDTDEAVAEQKRREETLLAAQEVRFGAMASGGMTEQEVVQGENAKPTDKIFRVDRVEDNALFEPYYDAVKKACVRINRVHRFSQAVYEENSQNGGLHIFFDLMLLKMAEAEDFALRKLHQYDQRTVEKVLKEYRRFTSEFLADLCREAGDDLPHDE